MSQDNNDFFFNPEDEGEDADPAVQLAVKPALTERQIFLAAKREFLLQLLDTWKTHCDNRRGSGGVTSAKKKRAA